MTLGKRIEPTEEMRKLLLICVDWYDYANNICGGELHIVLDDDNTDTYFLQKYLNEANIKQYDNYELAVQILKGLLKLSKDQRNWVTYNIHNVIRGDGERDIFEEIED